LIGALLVACSAETHESTATGDERVAAEEADFEVVEYQFVQHAESVTLEDGLLTLEGIGEDVLYFSDRPHRIVGRETVEWFVDAWDEGEESFAESPPNAVLTVKKEQELVDLTVVLKHPVLTDRTLVYSVEVLDGPKAGDPEPALPPVSAAFSAKPATVGVPCGVRSAAAGPKWVLLGEGPIPLRLPGPDGSTGEAGAVRGSHPDLLPPHADPRAEYDHWDDPLHPRALWADGARKRRGPSGPTDLRAPSHRMLECYPCPEATVLPMW